MVACRVLQDRRAIMGVRRGSSEDSRNLLQRRGWQSAMQVYDVVAGRHEVYEESAQLQILHKCRTLLGRSASSLQSMRRFSRGIAKNSTLAFVRRGALPHSVARAFLNLAEKQRPAADPLKSDLDIT